MKTRILISLIAALIAAAMPIGYGFIKLGGFTAQQFFLACLLFPLGFALIYTCPSWSNE